MSFNRILLLAVAGVCLAGIAAELRAENPSAEIAIKDIDGISANNLPHAAKVIIVGDHPEIATAFENAGVTVEVRSEKNAKDSAANPAKPRFSKMSKEELQAYLSAEPHAVAYESDANKAALQKLAEEKFAATLKTEGA